MILQRLSVVSKSILMQTLTVDSKEQIDFDVFYTAVCVYTYSSSSLHASHTAVYTTCRCYRTVVRTYPSAEAAIYWRRDVGDTREFASARTCLMHVATNKRPDATPPHLTPRLVPSPIRLCSMYSSRNVFRSPKLLCEMLTSSSRPFLNRLPAERI